MPEKATFKIRMTPDLEEAFQRAANDREIAQEMLDAAKKARRATGIFFIFGAIFALWGVISVVINSGAIQ